MAHSLVLAPALVFGVAVAAHADIRIPVPKRSKPTPVQQFNRAGVRALEKHDIKGAKRLFYKAYLLDPDDPFTLNNLGYIAELEGDIDRATRYYDLAASYQSEAVVDRSTDADAEGKSVATVAGHAESQRMQVNRMNVEAINLLRRDRTVEADRLLQEALRLDPQNPFTLNNLGYANEKQGELEKALGYYQRAANIRSNEPIVVTLKNNWRGKSISQIADDNARKVERELRETTTPEARVARLNLQGVSALNRNDREAARRYFEEAYKLAPDDAFTLNNMGYLAESSGDRETADYYYAKAQDAERANAKVGVATRRDAEGHAVASVAGDNGDLVAQRMQTDLERRRQSHAPTGLHQRGSNAIIPEPAKPQPKDDGTPTILDDEGGNPAPQAAPGQNNQPQATGTPR